MKIALITNDFLPMMGGITNVMINVSNNLTKFGETVYLLNKTYEDNKKLYFKVLSDEISVKGALVHNFTFIYFSIYLFFKIIFSFKGLIFKEKLKLAFFYSFYPKFIVRRIISIKNLVSFFRKFNCDIILSGTSGIPLLYSYILSKWFNVPMVAIAHGDDYLTRYPFKIKTHIFQEIQGIIVTNKIMKNLFLKIFSVNPNKIKIIHLGVDIKNSEVKESVSFLREQFGYNQRDFILLTVSRFYPRKGFETVLKALHLILKENKDILIKYLIIGEGEDKKRIKLLIKQLNLEENVILLGAVDDNLKNQYYKLSDLFVLVPEIKEDSIEGFGIVYIEANYFKLPVIGSYSGGIKMAIIDNKTGYLIKPKDELELKDKIMLLFNNKELCRDLGEYGHKRVLKLFDWEKNALVYQQVLNEAIKEYYL